MGGFTQKYRELVVSQKRGLASCIISFIARYCLLKALRDYYNKLMILSRSTRRVVELSSSQPLLIVLVGGGKAL